MNHHVFQKSTLHRHDYHLLCLVTLLSWSPKMVKIGFKTFLDVKLPYRVRKITVIPCRVLLISQERIGSFTRTFSRFYVIHICIYYEIV